MWLEIFSDIFYLSDGVAFAELNWVFVTILIVHNQKEFCKCCTIANVYSLGHLSQPINHNHKEFWD